MITTCVILVLAVAGAAVTIAKSRLFKALREWPRNRLWVAPCDEIPSPGWRLLDALMRCPYCITHWLTLAAVLAYQPRLAHGQVRPLDLLVTWMALTTASSLVAALLCCAYNFEEER